MKKANEIIRITFYKPDQYFLNLFEKHKNLKGDIQDFFGRGVTLTPWMFLKDTKTYISVEDAVFDEIDCEVDISDFTNFILFTVEGSRVFDEEFSISTLDSFIEKIVLIENQFLLDSKKLKLDIFNLNPISFAYNTVWNFWAYETITDCGTEYESGWDFLGVMDMENINYLKPQ